MSQAGRLQAIWLKPRHGGDMQAVKTAVLKTGAGLTGNADQGGRRQVTLLEQEVWDRVAGELQMSLEPATRRANLLLSGVRLAHSHERILKVGGCRLHIRGETKPCNLMDEACPGLRQALYEDWGGGVFGQVLDDGDIQVGDEVGWLDEGVEHG